MPLFERDNSHSSFKSKVIETVNETAIQLPADLLGECFFSATPNLLITPNKIAKSGCSSRFIVVENPGTLNHLNECRSSRFVLAISRVTRQLLLCCWQYVRKIKVESTESRILSWVAKQQTASPSRHETES